MGTNYYLHLGKRSSQGQGKPALMTWAVEAGPACRREVIWVADGVTVQDEYGKEMTWAEFLRLVALDACDHAHHGQAFS